MEQQCTRPDINEKLLLYLDKRVDEAELREISLHVKQCSVCSEEIKKACTLARILREHPNILSAIYDKGKCLSPQELIDYRDQRQELSVSAVAMIERHLNACLTCKQEYAFLTQVQEERHKQPVVPQVIQGEAKFLAAVAQIFQHQQADAKQRFGTETLSRLRGAFAEFREWTSDLFTPQAQLVYVRKALRRFQGNISLIKRRLAGFEVKIEIEERNANSADVVIFVSSASKKEKTGKIRAVLFHKEKEIRSVTVEKGRVSFKNISHGDYELVFLRQGQEIMRTQFKTHRSK